MDSSETIRLLDRFGDLTGRSAAAVALATHLGGAALYVFVADPDRPAKLIPARGCPSVPSIRGWRDLLARCRAPGIESGPVAYPDAASMRPACAYVFDGFTLVLVGSALPSLEVQAQLTLLARSLGSMFRAEADAFAARGELEVERRNAERAAALAQALDRARGDAERATRVKTEFLAMLGHELRNPLAPIVTALQLMRMEGTHSRSQDILERQVAHLTRLVDDLLDVSRITSGKIELRRERIEIAAIVQRALEMSRPLLEQRRNALSVEVPEQGLAVDGDPARLAQIVQNLLTNAAKYSDPGAAIEVRAEQSRGVVQLSIRDHGIGIDTSYLERVFEQFVQMRQGMDRSAGGLGLGLAIVKSLVEKHAGTVRVTSDGPGLGSTFVIELPLARSPAVPVRVAVPAVEVPVTPSPRRSARLLVVDDNVDAAVLLGEVLEAFGHDVHIANSGPDALAELERFTPEAAVLDIGLPVMDGYELAQRLKVRLPDVKLVALTGYGQPDDRERSRSAGFHAHLVKPVSMTEVMSTLDQLLG